ncbi:hypothetical protein [Nitrosovibrio tenuis]|uniref:Uncharacterized protein n=1 Tax=Nitrosovibrio tenuis TaxID=1233 RepID=A0A1H7IW02_9PROT|nr:hypothetical protein [Nitrosovibrio tenuis]SEK65830.1 hypothetical protein SAMN05216387_102296 [Nitrosovibrio tenuis]
MKEKFPAILFMLGLLTSCVPMSPYEIVDSPVLRKTVENARTRDDHQALTKHFETLAEEMRKKAEEQRKLLQHYEEKGYLYGRQAQDRRSHTWALMLKYEKAAKTSRINAASHRKIAAELERNSYGSSRRMAEIIHKPAAQNN